MSIQIGNSPFKQVYIGSTPIKEIYVGSKCVWGDNPRLVIILDDPYEEAPSSDCISIKVNGKHACSVWFDKAEADDLGDEYYFTNNKFVYTEVSNGDEITFGYESNEEVAPVEIICDDTPVEIDGTTTITLTVMPIEVYNQISIPYAEIENKFSYYFDFYSPELTVTLTTNRDEYTMTYTVEDYYSESDIVFIDNDFVYISDEERPVEAEWVFLTDIEDGSTQYGSIVFEKDMDEDDGRYIGKFES